MDSAMEKLQRMIKVVIYMIRKGFLKQKLAVGPYILFARGKPAGKAIGSLLASLGHGLGHRIAGRRSMHPEKESFYRPGEVEFSCGNTPSYPVREEEDGGRVDREAEEFIRRFYEQLRLQRSVPATPDQS